jgi:hypothetical protein
MTKSLNPALHLDGPTEMMLTMPLQRSDLRLSPGISNVLQRVGQPP